MFNPKQGMAMNRKHMTLLVAVALSTVAPAHAKKNESSKKQEVKQETISDETCKAYTASKPGLNGFAFSAIGGILSVDNKVTNATTTFSIENKNTYKVFGMGLTHFWTKPNNVVFGLGIDVLKNFGEKTTTGKGVINTIPVDGTGAPAGFPNLKVPVDIDYTQKRPLTIVIGLKAGYAYNNFVPYAMLNVRESIIKHTFKPTGTYAAFPTDEQDDINVSLEYGIGFMYKINSFGIGAEVAYHNEKTLGLEGYGTGKNNGTYSAQARLSWFF
jgi:hypothetical protein